MLPSFWTMIVTVAGIKAEDACLVRMGRQLPTLPGQRLKVVTRTTSPSALALEDGRCRSCKMAENGNPMMRHACTPDVGASDDGHYYQDNDRTPPPPQSIVGQWQTTTHKVIKTRIIAGSKTLSICLRKSGNHPTTTMMVMSAACNALDKSFPQPLSQTMVATSGAMITEWWCPGQWFSLPQGQHKDNGKQGLPETAEMTVAAAFRPTVNRHCKDNRHMAQLL